LETAAQSEISQIIGANEISAAAAVSTLQNQQAGVASGTPLYQVINNELAILSADPATLDATVGTGTSAQIQNQAIAVTALLASSPSAANQILGDIAGRITG